MIGFANKDSKEDLFLEAGANLCSEEHVRSRGRSHGGTKNLTECNA
jgi:hypothetical protein